MHGFGKIKQAAGACVPVEALAPPAHGRLSSLLHHGRGPRAVNLLHPRARWASLRGCWTLLHAAPLWAPGATCAAEAHIRGGAACRPALSQGARRSACDVGAARCGCAGELRGHRRQLSAAP